jgi:predicted nuclease of predicted toxin-antitoxin system
VKFLVDNQLPDALARFLTSQGHDARHVLDLKLDEADDLTIWSYAVAEDYTLVSKDQDFLHLANASTSGGTFIWVRVGNCRKQSLIAAFERALPAIVVALGEGQRVIELR